MREREDWARGVQMIDEPSPFHYAETLPAGWSALELVHTQRLRNLEVEISLTPPNGGKIKTQGHPTYSNSRYVLHL